MVGVVQTGLGAQQQIAFLVLLDVGTLVEGAQHRKALVAALQDRLELTLVAAVDVVSEDMPGLGSTTERDANLDRALEQIMQPCAALEDRAESVIGRLRAPGRAGACLVSAQVSYQRVQDHLERLKMHAALQSLDQILERAQKREQLPVEVLDELLGQELAERFERRIKVNFKFSGLPMLKRLEQFDYAAQPQVSRRTIEELATLRFVAAGENVVFLGPCGVGKTHLSIDLAVKALELGHRVYFLTLHDLVTRARQARRRDQLHVLLRNVLRADLFLLDELGFLPLEAADATFLFEVINKRYQATKPTVTSNKSFGQWNEIFPDTTLSGRRARPAAPSCHHGQHPRRILSPQAPP